MDETPTIAPTDRSNSPAIISMPIGMAMMPSSDDVSSQLAVRERRQEALIACHEREEGKHRNGRDRTAGLGPEQRAPERCSGGGGRPDPLFPRAPRSSQSWQATRFGKSRYFEPMTFEYVEKTLEIFSTFDLSTTLGPVETGPTGASPYFAYS